MLYEVITNILYRRELAQAEDPDVLRAQLVQEYREAFANPYVAASWGYIDDVIEHDLERDRQTQSLV